MKKRKLVSLLMSGALVFGLLAGCGGGTQTNNETPDAQNSQAGGNEGGAFEISMSIASEPQTIDPAKNSAVDGAIMTSHMFEGLMRWEDSVPTEWLLQNFDGAYRVILVGDAAMHPGELFSQQYNWRQRTPLPSGLDWLLRLKSHFPHLIWLNPEPLPSHGGFWAQTHLELAKQFPMYQLSVEGLEAGMRRLMAR